MQHSSTYTCGGDGGMNPLLPRMLALHPYVRGWWPKKGPRDVNELAFRIVHDLTGEELLLEEPAKDPVAVKRGTKGGKKGARL